MTLVLFHTASTISWWDQNLKSSDTEYNTKSNHVSFRILQLEITCCWVSNCWATIEPKKTNPSNNEQLNSSETSCAQSCNHSKRAGFFPDANTEVTVSHILTEPKIVWFGCLATCQQLGEPVLYICASRIGDGSASNFKYGFDDRHISETWKRVSWKRFQKLKTVLVWFEI